MTQKDPAPLMKIGGYYSVRVGPYARKRMVWQLMRIDLHKIPGIYNNGRPTFNERFVFRRVRRYRRFGQLEEYYSGWDRDELGEFRFEGMTNPGVCVRHYQPPTPAEMSAMMAQYAAEEP